MAINYNPEASIDDGSCYFNITGCTDPTALNYNSEATLDDNSCVYPENPCDIHRQAYLLTILYTMVVFNWSYLLLRHHII